MSLRSAGKTEAAKRCNEALETNPTKALRIIKAGVVHAKMFWYIPKSTVFVYWSSFVEKSIEKKFEVKQKLRNATSNQITT